MIPRLCGVIYACYFHLGHKLGVIATESRTKMSILCMYKHLGHCKKEMTRKVAKHLCRIVKQCSMSPCESCSKTKAREKISTKSSNRKKAKVNCGNFFLTP